MQGFSVALTGLLGLIAGSTGNGNIESIETHSFRVSIKVAFTQAYAPNAEIPDRQPFSNEPLFHNGIETLEEGFKLAHPEVVDWVLIELRSADNPTERVDSVAALITNEGQIIGIDGSSEIEFHNATADRFFISVTNAHHLDFHTSSPVKFDHDQTHHLDF